MVLSERLPISIALLVTLRLVAYAIIRATWRSGMPEEALIVGAGMSGHTVADALLRSRSGIRPAGLRRWSRCPDSR